jgi:predicted metal-dependent peptidase
MVLTAEDRITKAHIALMQDKRTLAYSGLLMVGKVEVKDDCPTAKTNGRDIVYGRAFVESLTDGELRFLILHETKHKLYQHLFVWRKIHEEDAMLANMACDYVINLEIQDLNKWGDFLVMPKVGLVDEKYRGLDGAQSLDEAEKEELAKEINSAVRTGALLAGKQGGEVDRSFDAAMQAQVDWAEQLREFVSTVCAGKGDSTWAKPNRRWLQHDVYMPSQISESIGSICVGIDTSGSISGEAISKALAELVSICNNTTPEKVDLLYWDTEVAAHEQYREDNYSGLVTSTKPKGGGGSSSLCVFDYVVKNKLDPKCIIMITDGYIEFPQTAASCPTIWVMVENKITVPPFGSVIRVR